MSRARLIVPLCVAAAAFTIAACGGDTEEKNDYVDQVNEVTTTLNEGLTEISTGAAAATPEEAAKVFADFGAELDTAAADIEAIDPPEDVADLHQQLVTEVEDLGATATNAADEIEQGGPAAVTGVATEFITEATTASTEVDSTITEINAKLQE
jgi:hypothetical protein